MSPFLPITATILVRCLTEQWPCRASLSDEIELVSEMLPELNQSVLSELRDSLSLPRATVRSFTTAATARQRAVVAEHKLRQRQEINRIRDINDDLLRWAFIYLSQVKF